MVILLKLTEGNKQQNEQMKIQKNIEKIKINEKSGKFCAAVRLSSRRKNLPE